MRTIGAACALAAILSCGSDRDALFNQCYASMTANRTNEQPAHVDHCDAQVAIKHASRAGCPADHAKHSIRTDVLTAHCDAIQ